MGLVSLLLDRFTYSVHYKRLMASKQALSARKEQANIQVGHVMQADCVCTLYKQKIWGMEEKYYKRNLGSVDLILCKPMILLLSPHFEYTNKCIECLKWNIYVVVQIFPWFKFFQTSLIFIFLCFRL